MDEKKESASGVTQRIYEANVLFGVAVNSAASIQAPVRAGGQLHALVSLVFSVIAVEALLNEATEMAGRFSKYAGEPQVVPVFAERLAEAEKAHESLESKLALAYEILGKKLDKGALPYHKDLIRRFGRNKNLLAEDMEAGSWMRAIETKAIANWSCSTAARVVVEFVSKAPQGAWRTFLEGIHRHFKPYASKPLTDSL